MPELVQEWHPTKNGNLNPNDITIGSHTKVWWKCLRCGYEWQAEVRRRGIRGNGCPCCAGQKVLHGFNDLATTHPELANEWHPSKNGKLNPTNITAGSSKRVWWKCQKCGHEWQTTVSGRRGCPKCVKKKNKGQLSFDFK